ncbi:hypothetical protein P3T27_007525 [Kitasatospora sp. MAA19]|uniref:hypothetical protein n=1 Tax=unclassified Kitasatospora TaxID=2633591 RepID=UPI002473B442|nr:hypothetical protein [Kitasatospora sp. MAA19]MDH6710774.1 hypothetical protein [Kitasatospora sp. MAA19]
MTTARRPLNTGPLPAERQGEEQALIHRRGSAVERLLVPGLVGTPVVPVVEPQAPRTGRRPLAGGIDRSGDPR